MEAELLQDLLANEYPNVKYWISFQCKDAEKLAHGENFAQTVKYLWEKSKKLPNHKNIIAIGVNCTHPKNVAPLLKSVNGTRSVEDRIPLVAYPNSGEIYNVSEKYIFIYSNYCTFNYHLNFFLSALVIQLVGLAKRIVFHWKVMQMNGSIWDYV